MLYCLGARPSGAVIGGTTPNGNSPAETIEMCEMVKNETNIDSRSQKVQRESEKPLSSHLHSASYRGTMRKKSSYLSFRRRPNIKSNKFSLIVPLHYAVASLLYFETIEKVMHLLGFGVCNAKPQDP